MVVDITAALDAGPGAMYWRNHDRSGELARLDTAPRPLPHLAVMTPAGLACLDCPATGGNKQPGRYWTRSGEPPNVTVTPSLEVGEADGSQPYWHGHLTAGVLA